MRLAQTDSGGWLDRYYGIRDGWSGQTSFGAVLWLVALLAGVLLLLYVVWLLHRWWRARQTYNPRALFNQVLRSLSRSLTVPQRDLLQRIGRELNLAHPTVLLLTRDLFITYTNRWMSATRRADLNTRQRLDQLAGVLFPNQAFD